MPAACASQRPHDRVGDWLEELALMCQTAASLPESARAAVLDVLNAFEEEDGALAPDAIRLRLRLISAAKPPTPRSRQWRLSRRTSPGRRSSKPTPEAATIVAV
jgi:hypothetical protein